MQIKNPYGLMRAPWNCNKNQYVTRYSSFCGQSWTGGTENMPSCEVREEDDDAYPSCRSLLSLVFLMMSFLFLSSSQTHYNMVAEYNTWDEFGSELPYLYVNRSISSVSLSFFSCHLSYPSTYLDLC